VGGFSLAILICFFLMQGTDYRVTGQELLSGFAFKIPTGGMLVAIALMGSVGVTAGEMFMYPYWVKEKGYGRYVGPRTAANREEWARRQRGWMTVLKADALICTLIATVITIAYYLIAAAILRHGLGIVPTGIEVVKGLANMFTESYGGWSYGLIPSFFKNSSDRDFQVFCDADTCFEFFYFHLKGFLRQLEYTTR